jgi:CMP-N,N'-diacetyllegionaminic acid synthase
MKTIAIIPARSGSKSLRNKNIRSIAGKPLLAWSIEHAKKSRMVDRVLVSTDSELYRQIALDYGAEAPFLRPAEFAQDHSRDFEVFQHALNWLKENEAYFPDLTVHLWPTSPIRRSNLIDEVIQRLLDTPQADSIRTVVKSKMTPYKMWFSADDKLMQPVVRLEGHESFNMPRQELPVAYMQNACVQVFRTDIIESLKSMSGRAIVGFEMEDDYDIDDEEDWIRAEAKLMMEGDAVESVKDNTLAQSEKSRKCFCFDIDGVIASLTPDNDYRNAKPIKTSIEAIQSLYKCGHEIILFTARGTKTGIDWRSVTEAQMRDWEVPYHELRFGKPAADVFIDDRMLGVDQVLTLTRMLKTK